MSASSFFVPVGLTVTGEPASSTATSEQVASNPIPLTSSAEMSETTDCEQEKMKSQVRFNPWYALSRGKISLYLDDVADGAPNVISGLLVEVRRGVKDLERACSHLLYLPARGDQGRSDATRPHVHAHEEVHARRSCGQLASAIPHRARSTRRPASSMSCKEEATIISQPYRSR